MGLKVPDPPDDYGYGDDCPACWAAGKTPNYVFIRFWDVAACGANPAPPNGWPFICKQLPLQACKFTGTLEFGGFTWQAIYIAWSGEIELIRTDFPSLSYFWKVGGACCRVFPVNDNTCPAWGGENGRALVTYIIDHIIILLTSCYHFVTLPGTLYERWEVGIDHWVYRLANVRDKTNCLFLIDDEETVPPWDA